MEPEFLDEERVPLIDRYENNDDSVYEDSQAETSFSDIQQEATEAELRSRERNLEKKDEEINALERRFNVQIPPEERVRFRRSSGYLQIEKSPGEFVNITKSNGEFLAESTMRTRLGASLARELLGIETPSSVRSRTRVLIQDIPTELEMNDLSPQRLEEVISEVTRSIGINTDFDMREILGIDKALTRIKGELTNNVGKLTEIDAHITRENNKLAEIRDSPDLQVHEERVKKNHYQPKRRAECEARDRFSESQRIGFSIFAHTTDCGKNSRRGHEPQRETQGHSQGTWIDNHRGIDITWLDNFNDRDGSHRWYCYR